MANNKKAMEAYMEKIGERPLLTDEEEFQLARRIQEGDPNAVGLLVESNLRFVLSLAHQYKGQGVSLDDLVSEGNIGMIQAAKRFQPEKGKRFVKFAAPIIRDAMERFVNKNGAFFKMPAKDTSSTAARRNHPVSMDAPIPAGSNNNFNLLNLLVNANSPYADADFIRANDEAHMNAILERLDERERQVISLLYGIGTNRHTMAEAGLDMGLKRERVRQIRDKALRKMKKGLKA
ncbi:MAG: sigma-70 family RNA polymerase sigma factor [Prevotella sp.]|jgi:RNA polymerase primary sigma factor|nr:sigma-70 family RNA polymerase sigma factor [Prevotella sp.]